MTIKERILESISQKPMTAREVAAALSIDNHLASQMIYELRDKLAPDSTRRNHRNQYAYVWKIRDAARAREER